jgi:hypothetical protein
MTKSTAASYIDRAPNLEDDRMMNVAAQFVFRRASSRLSNDHAFSGGAQAPSTCNARMG